MFNIVVRAVRAPLPPATATGIASRVRAFVVPGDPPRVRGYREPAGHDRKLPRNRRFRVRSAGHTPDGIHKCSRHPHPLTPPPCRRIFRARHFSRSVRNFQTINERFPLRTGFRINETVPSPSKTKTKWPKSTEYDPCDFVPQTRRVVRVLTVIVLRGNARKIIRFGI